MGGLVGPAAAVFRVPEFDALRAKSCLVKFFGLIFYSEQNIRMVLLQAGHRHIH